MTENNSKHHDISELLLRIEELREAMITASRLHSLTHKQVLHYSEELDKLIMEVQLSQQKQSPN